MLIVTLNFFLFKNDKTQHALKVKLFSVNLEFQMQLSQVFLDFSDWFLKNESGIKTKYLELKQN